MTQVDPGTEIKANEITGKFGRDIFNDFDIDDPVFNDHFFDILDALVAGCPVARSNVGDGYWMVNRQADVRKVGQDWQTFSSAKGYMPNRPEGLPVPLCRRSPTRPSTPRGARSINPFLSPKAVADTRSRSARTPIR